MPRKFSPGVFALQAFVVIFFVFMLAPILVVFVASFGARDYVSFPMDGFSLKWYRRVYEYKPFLNSLVFSIQLAIASTILAGLLGVPAGLALSRARSNFGQFLTMFLLAPLSIPLIVFGLALLYYMSLLGFGIGFWPLLIGHAAVGLPYIVRTVTAVHRSLDVGIEESASILGATRWQIVRHVTLPLIRSAMFAGFLFCMLSSLDNLTISFFFGTATTSTLPVVMLSYLEYQFDPSIAAIGVIQMALTIIVLLAVDRVYGLGKLNIAD
jgi:putative spermidine/putrescine transport system permease protein